MIISQTPLRISFVGGGTDLPSYYEKYGGNVLSTAIDKYVYVIIKARYDNKIVLNYSKKEIIESVDEINHLLIKEAFKKTGIYQGVEVTTIADIPSSGSGLGSSSSLTVGLLNAFYHFKGVSKNNFELAEEACDIEIKTLRNPIGKQDQYAASFGGFRWYKFLNTGKVEIVDLNISPSDLLHLESNLYLVYTNITRNANNILSTQNTNVKEQKNIDELHLLSAMPKKLKGELESGNNDVLGEMLLENWMLKKKLAEGITINEIDALMELGLKNGALGGKLLGAGGGGFVLFYVPDGNKINFVKTILSSPYKMLPIRFEKYGTRIILNIGMSHQLI